MANDAIAFIEGLIRAEPRSQMRRERVGLAPISELLKRIGAPQDDLVCVHLAGSKGKGSTALLLESMVSATGRRVGTFTSPHLVDWCERFRVDGEPVSRATLERAVGHIRPAVMDQQRADELLAPSFFDVLVASALWMFRQAGAELAILETGLGGRLDATNVVRPRVTCITTIELEHTDRLGETLGEIAREKAGIIKPGTPVVVGELPQPAARVVEARAESMVAPLYRLGKEIAVRSAGRGRLHISAPGVAVDAAFEHPSAFMADNAALAVGCAAALVPTEGPVDGATLATGLADAKLPGRFEVISRAPTVIIDGAHTRDSMQAVAKTLGRFEFERLHLVVSLSHDKHPLTVLEPLLASAATVTVTTALAARSMPADALALALAPHVSPPSRLRVEVHPARAVRSVRQSLRDEDLLCVTGSMYLAGVAREALLGA